MANTNTSGSSFNLDNATKAWNWQVCSEFIFRNGVGNDTMFQPEPFNLTIRLDYCNTKYHIRPRTHWVSTYFNGYDMRSTLKQFGSNIIFSNGLMDPFSSFGVLEDISKTVVAITTEKGSHCLDFYDPRHDDPKWLNHQRKKEMKIISRWVKESHSSSNSPLVLFIWFSFSLVFTFLI
ncbi:uncharacterized protein [Spinacia oleracea]|uniref:Uncharacterized protein n=1 Tax=Spinacia oleracea TaxID=3562 RepID=A0ABM3QGN7_SPIOL|nr:uncharacterized protein LOC130459281 [Spinacia oleracea]